MVAHAHVRVIEPEPPALSLELCCGGLEEAAGHDLALHVLGDLLGRLRRVPEIREEPVCRRAGGLLAGAEEDRHPGGAGEAGHVSDVEPLGHQQRVELALPHRRGEALRALRCPRRAGRGRRHDESSSSSRSITSASP